MEFCAARCSTNLVVALEVDATIEYEPAAPCMLPTRRRTAIACSLAPETMGTGTKAGAKAEAGSFYRGAFTRSWRIFFSASH